MQIRLVQRHDAQGLRGGRVRLGRADIAENGRINRPCETLAVGNRETRVRSDPIVVHGLGCIQLHDEASSCETHSKQYETLNERRTMKE